MTFSLTVKYQLSDRLREGDLQSGILHQTEMYLLYSDFITLAAGSTSLSSFQQLLNPKLDDRSQDVCEKVFKRQSPPNSGTSLKPQLRKPCGAVGALKLQISVLKIDFI